MTLFIVLAVWFPAQKPLRKTKCNFPQYVLPFSLWKLLNPFIRVPHRIGYARVSSVGQNLDSQLDALQKAGCKKIFSDKMTDSRMDRPGWDQLMEYVRPRDALVVTGIEPYDAEVMVKRNSGCIRWFI